MRVLITGVTGLIGKEVGKLLAEKGVEIFAVSRNPARARLELPFPAKLFKWIDTSDNFPEAALEGVDGVIHLAGEPVANSRWTKTKKDLIYNSRILGTRSLVTAIVQMKGPRPKHFVSGSAIGFYGDRNDELLNESSTAGQGFLAQLVQDWESEVSRLEKTGLHVAKIRTALVFSRHGGAFERLLSVFLKSLGGNLASGHQWMSWIHIVDIARIFVYCLENERASGVFNASAPEPVRNDRFTVALARALGRSVFLPVPELALKAVLGEGSSAVLASLRVMPTRLQELGFNFTFPDLESALRDLCEPVRDGAHEWLAEQWVSQQPSEIFPYLSNVENLEELTPSSLKFKVIGKTTEKMTTGTKFDYRLSIHGIPMRWQSEITNWQSGEKFSDKQVRGPYSQWHHTHEFIPFAGGTLLRDRVHYKLPLGFWGDILAGWQVTREVAQIFAYRRKIIDQKFGAET